MRSSSASGRCLSGNEYTYMTDEQMAEYMRAAGKAAREQALKDWLAAGLDEKDFVWPSIANPDPGTE